MKSFNRFVAFLLAIIVTPALFAGYPLPGSDKQAVVLCKNCLGTNFNGEKNDGKPTMSYTAPIAKHVGRLVDSYATKDIQAAYGGPSGTVRAMKIRLAPGTSPTRIYVKMGRGIGAYTLSTFFSSKLPAGTVSIATMADVKTSRTKYGSPNEELTPWDAYIYAENYGAAWQVTPDDKQDVLHDFDVDDRGLVYTAYTVWGWGIHQDSGETGGALLPVIKATIESASSITVVKAGSSYYVAVCDGSATHKIWNVTSPGNPTAVRTASFGIRAWAHNDAAGRIAVLDDQSRIRVYDNNTFAVGGSPLFGPVSAPSGRSFSDLTFDESGNLWASEESGAYNAGFHRFTPSGGTYTQSTFPVGESFSAKAVPPNSQLITAGGGYVSLAGGGSRGSDVHLFKVEGSTVRKIDLKNFFNKYYHAAPSGFANPASDLSYVVSPYGLKLVKQGTKLYLMYNANGMGDVYELEAGDSLGASMKTANFGTANPNSKGGTGPFLGDVVKFVANSSNPAVAYQVSWDFGNPESAANLAQTATGAEASHQFSGYTTTTQINTIKKVVATAVNDSSLTDTVNVTIKVPTPRIGVAGTATAISAAGPAFDVIAGDTFTDASDGSVESHFATWTIGTSAAVNALPSQTIPVGAIGPHTVTLTTSYGRYDAGTFAPATSMYSPSVSNQPYVVRPFVATIGATKSGTNALFSATSRVTTNTQILTATTWTYTWTLKNGPTVVQTQTGTAALGTVPNFTVPMNSVPNGGVVTLDVEVPALNLVGAPEYAKYTDMMTLEKPVPAIAKNGCANANAPCTLTASGPGVSTSTVTWTLTGPATINGTGNPFSPSITVPGTYTATVVAVKGIFEGTDTLTPISVAASLCGAPPTSDQIAVSHSCATCEPNDIVTFKTSVFGYTRQDCDVYNWNFGDSSSAGSGKETTHKFANAGTYNVRLTISNSSGSSPTVITYPITIGNTTTPPPPDPPTCNKPTAITIEYSGSSCGSSGGQCKSGQRIGFTAYKNNGDQLSLSCDTASWDFGDNTTGTGRTSFHTYASPGTYNVTVRVSSSAGSSQASLPVTITQGTDSGSCNTAPTVDNLILDFRGATCSSLNGDLCQRGENIQFDVKTFGYTFQSCDKFEWSFGDNSTAAVKNPTHAFTGPAPSYRVSVRVYNTANPSGVTLTADVPFDNAPLEPTPTIAITGPITVGKGVAVTFNASATLNGTAALATGWSWNFGDGSAKDNSQAGLKSATSTVQHVFTKTGTFTVSVTAKNAADTTDRSTGTGLLTNVNVSETPVYRFLLPAVIHDNGQNSSLWRTDVQVYYSAPNPSAEPLTMTAEFNGGSKQLLINQATFIYEDFVSKLIDGNGSGTVILTTQAKYKPQIWTRTYNVDPSGKTFGQFIPAIELTGSAGSAVDGSAESVKYYLSGLRQNARYRTNVGFINTSAGEIIADVTAYDDLQTPLKRFAITLPQYQLKQISLASSDAIGSSVPNRPISLEISIPAGKQLVAYASFIDGASNDPVYISATPGAELASADYGISITPGVGHVGAWRSDVTVFNPDDRSPVTFDLEYYDAEGLRRGAARNLTLGPLQSKNYEDLLHVSELFSPAPPDGVGMLKLRTFGQPARYPLTFSRTYNDKGTGGTFGQGIPGFAASHANVKPGKPAIIPGVRSNTSYKTNVGLTNTSSNTVDVKVSLLDPNSGAVAHEEAYRLYGDASIVATYPFGSLSTGTLKVEVIGGDGGVWAFASVIDLKSEDPEYVPGVPVQ